MNDLTGTFTLAAPVAMPPPNGEGPAADPAAAVRQLEWVDFIGPLPPPAVLQQYDAVQKGFTRTLLEQFAKEGDHRRELELREPAARRDELLRQRHHERLGQLLGFGV